MDVLAYLAERAQLVDRLLERAVPPASEPPERLHAAMRHLLFPGGKRFRPALAFAGAEAVGGRPEAALPVAAAVELVHTYSLVHDDLPCMDDDVERRGKPTVHVAFGEATAVLAGDALLAAAFEVLAGAPAESVRELASSRPRSRRSSAIWKPRPRHSPARRSRASAASPAPARRPPSTTATVSRAPVLRRWIDSIVAASARSSARSSC